MSKEKAKMIIQGWGNYLFDRPDVREMAERRAAICAKCPHAVTGQMLKFMPDKSIQEIEGMKCDICGCPLSAAVRSREKKCDLGKW